MTDRVTCIIFTRDTMLLERVMGQWTDLANLRHADTINQLHVLIGQMGACLLAIDLRHPRATDMLTDIARHAPECVVIALGVIGSQPLIAAEQSSAFEVADIEADHHQLLSMLRRALTHLRVKQELRLVREESRLDEHRNQPSLGLPLNESPSLLLPLRDLSRAFRHFQQLDVLYEYIVEGLAGAMKLARVGLFAKDAQSGEYILRTGVRTLPETNELRYAEDDALISWMKMYGHLISRAALHHEDQANDRYLLKQALSVMGAEVIMPLHARGQLFGWVFLGRRAAGYPFETGDLDDLSLVADHISVIIENALLHRETNMQKILAETMLDAIPTGIIAVDENGRTLWFNDATTAILELEDSTAPLHRPIDEIDRHLGHLLRETLRADGDLQEQEWREPATQRLLSIQTRRLGSRQQCLGAVAFVRDLTEERLLQERQAELERAKFWAELAASMAHEIRNPLVSIKAFAQLLPEHYEDPEFRERFTELVPKEVDRLDNIVNQIHTFANPPELSFTKIAPRELVERASRELSSMCKSMNAEITIEPKLGELPPIYGDPALLQDAIGHLLRNALEASQHSKPPRITITLSTKAEAVGNASFLITIDDNGQGIPADRLQRVFSPFNTTKTQGMGLGLPIARRTVLDHGGWIVIEPLPEGTRVLISLPRSPKHS